jgi:Predicted membrane protein (DUF2306)
MNTLTLSSEPTHVQRAATWLRRSVRAWLALALLGQAFFAAYVIGFYGRTAMNGDFHLWNKVLPKGWRADDALANGVTASHLAFTVLVLMCGALQLWPQLRARWPALHRWSGRLYLLLGMVLALGGLAMLWVYEGGAGSFSMKLGTSFNAMLIFGFGVLAWRAALQRRFAEHRRWALRLWLVVAGVWFFRVGLMAWLILNQGPAGFDPKTFSGPALTALAFAQTLLPLAVLEAVLRAERQPRWQAPVAGLMAVLTLLTLVGVGGAAAMMWWPRMH